MRIWTSYTSISHVTKTTPSLNKKMFSLQEWTMMMVRMKIHRLTQIMIQTTMRMTQTKAMILIQVMMAERKEMQSRQTMMKLQEWM